MPRRPALRPDIAQLQRGFRNPGHPEPGYFTLRLAKRAAPVPAAIWRINHEPGARENILDTGPILVATIGDDEADPMEVWARGAKITAAQYQFLMDERKWALEYAPDDPVANPYQPINLSKKPSLF